MKILFLTDSFPPEVNAPATRTFEHCVEWVKAGAEVTVITCAPNFPQGKVYPGYRNKLIQREMKEGIRVIRVWTYMAENKGVIKRTLDYISFMVSGWMAGLRVPADVIIATSPHFFTAIGGFLLSVFKRKPWIMEIRDLWPESILGVNALKRNPILDFFFWLEVRLYRHASGLVPVTDTFRLRIIEKGADPRKIHVIKNGSNLDLFYPRPADPVLRESICPPDRWLLSYIGTHGMAHGLDFIVGCAPELNKLKVTLLLIGDGAEKEKVTAMVKKEGYQNVICLPPVPKENIPAYLNISDLSLIPLKKKELFTTVIPSKIFETAAMQVPIVLGVDGEARNLVESFHAGLFYEPENKDDLLDKIRILTLDSNLRQRCARGGAELAASFDRKRLAATFLEHIQNITEKH